MKSSIAIPPPAAQVRSSMYFTDTKAPDGKTVLRVADMVWDSPASLRRQIYFFASMKDQYSYVLMTLPSDVPLNRMLRESQLPHRVVEHAVAKVTPITRLQLRILDHKRFLEAIKWPLETRGRATVAVKECEGNVSMLRIDVSDGRAR